MKVDTEDFSCEPWADSLSIRIQLPLDAENNDSSIDTSDEDTGPRDTFPRYLRKGRFTRISKASLMALRDLAVEQRLVLFTPFVIPAGPTNAVSNDVRHGDPFETFGRQLAKHHPNICHVPYVTSIGFTETHLDFVADSEAVITVICEPEQPLKEESMVGQHEFAKAALKAHRSRATRRSGDREFVLVQCATAEARRHVQQEFANFVETDVYNEQAAVHLADTILSRT